MGEKKEVLGPNSRATDDLLRALGLGDEHVTGITFRLTTAGAATLDVSLLMTREQALGMAEVFKRYKLVEIGPDEDLSQ